MSNFINDRIKEFREGFVDDGTGMGLAAPQESEPIEAFLRQSLLDLVEDIGKRIDTGCRMTCKNCDMEQGYEEWCECLCHNGLSQIQTLLQSYKKDL